MSDTERAGDPVVREPGATVWLYRSSTAEDSEYSTPVRAFASDDALCRWADAQLADLRSSNIQAAEWEPAPYGYVRPVLGGIGTDLQQVLFYEHAERHEVSA